MKTKRELQSKKLRQTVILMRVKCRRGIFLVNVRSKVVASNLGDWLGPPPLLSELAIQ